MLALSDEALAHLCIAATAVDPKKRDKWLRKIARQIDPPRQVRYYRAKREGLVVISPRCDPTSMAEFLHDCGVRVLYQDRDTLAAGIEQLLKLWELGQLQVSSSG
jgi:hypothetical protein